MRRKNMSPFGRTPPPAPEPRKQGVNINTADAGALQTLAGVGPVLASRIIAGRPYGALAEVAQVQGVSASTIQAWVAHV